MDMNELFILSQKMRRENKYLREGQAYFNALYVLNPSLADEIRGDRFDPYYRDDRIQKFLDYVASIS